MWWHTIINNGDNICGSNAFLLAVFKRRLGIRGENFHFSSRTKVKIKKGTIFLVKVPFFFFEQQPFTAIIHSIHEPIVGTLVYIGEKLGVC